MGDAKELVRAFWEREACGERYAAGATPLEALAAQGRRKYELEPYIPEFARFAEGRDARVLEIGVGMGVDHAEWAKSRPAYLAGVDLTGRAVSMTGARLAGMGLHSDLRVADAEQLPFDDGRFDLVYSWGAIHHTPDPARAFREVHRVLRPGGVGRFMLYRKYGVLFLAMWARFALLGGRPTLSIDEVVADHAESPGTRAYSAAALRDVLALFAHVELRAVLSHGDLLEGDVGARHRGPLLSAAKWLWPRRLLRRMPSALGSQWLVDVVK